MSSFRINGVVDSSPGDAPPDDAADLRRPLPDVGGLYRSGEVRILILDDDPSVCNLMHAALAPNGFKIDVVADPSEMEAVMRRAPITSSSSTT